jgi:uncharacterized protein (TIGR03437 family)
MRLILAALLVSAPAWSAIFVGIPNPRAIDAGGPSFTITLSGGSGFVQGSAVNWAGSPLSTRFFSSAQLSATVPSSAITSAGLFNLTVTNPDGAVSNAFVVEVLPVLSAINPSHVAAGTSVAVTATGLGFHSNCSIGSTGFGALTSTLVNSTTLTALVFPAAIGSPGRPGQLYVGCYGVSSRAILPIEGHNPSITSLSPASRISNGPAFAVTVNGSYFVSGALVFWNATPLQPISSSATQLTITVPANLTAAPGSNAVTVQNPGGPYISNPVTFTVSQAPLGVTSVSPAFAIATGPPVLLTLTGTAFATGATVLFNGSPLSTTLVSSTQLIAGVPANLLASPGVATIQVRVGGGVSNTVAFPVSPEPSTSPGFTINLASGDHPVAPGSLISIFGYNLAPGEATANTAPAPTTLNGTSLTINGVPAPLLYVSRTQINAQVPYEVSPGPGALVIQAGDLKSASVAFPVYPIAPGVWRLPNTLHVLAVNAADGTLNGADHPAFPGQYVTIYLTGQGAVTNPVPTGAAAPTSPYSIPVAPVLVKVGGQTASTPFAGLAPGFIGLLQINLEIPDVPAGEQRLDVVVGDVPANPGSTMHLSIGSR